VRLVAMVSSTVNAGSFGLNLYSLKVRTMFQVARSPGDWKSLMT